MLFRHAFEAISSTVFSQMVNRETTKIFINEGIVRTENEAERSFHTKRGVGSAKRRFHKRRSTTSPGACGGKRHASMDRAVKSIRGICALAHIQATDRPASRQNCASA